MPKPKVGIYAITGCHGCLLSVIFNEDEILDLINAIDLRAFPFIKEENPDDKFDLVILEGTVVSNDDVEMVKKLRERTLILACIGTCSCHGGIPTMKHFTPKENVEYLMYEKRDFIKDNPPKPVSAHVKVDYELSGCPPDKKEILTFIKDILLGKVHHPYTKPVCDECRLKENHCLLEDGKICLGPVTVGNCDAVCTSNGLECYGCRGPTQDANLKELIKLFKEKGIDEKDARDRINTFVGLFYDDNNAKSHN